MKRKIHLDNLGPYIKHKNNIYRPNDISLGLIRLREFAQPDIRTSIDKNQSVEIQVKDDCYIEVLQESLQEEWKKDISGETDDKKT